MGARRGSRVWRWLKRGLLGLVVLVAALAGLGFAYQTIATGRDLGAFPPPGQLVDIGGRRLHVVCAGTGSPTVILEAGLGGFSPDWTWVQQKVAPVARVCAYDRAGMGWSDRGPGPRDANAIAADLHALLASPGFAAPFVLVGHSIGGLYVRAYAAAYPADVAGVVLVDSSHPDQWTKLPGATDQYAMLARIYAVARVAARLGLVRTANIAAADPELPPGLAPARTAMANRVSAVDATADEFGGFTAASAILGRAGTLGDKPLYVLSAGVHDDTAGGEPAWRLLQDELAALSTNSLHLVVPDATHMSLLTREKDADATSAAVLVVVAAVREGTRLAGAAP